MLARLALRNVRRSARDFAIYFVTLVLGVCLFYAFGSISAQSVLFDLQAASDVDTWRLVDRMMSLFSVVVAIVLGFLVVYANSFLLKRRKKEFGIYLLLGMKPGQVSVIVVMETLSVGVIALVAGLLLGFGVSQLLSFVSAGVFGLIMKNYTFVFSLDALLRTLAAFALIFALVTVLNVVQVRRQRLVTLLSSRVQGGKAKGRKPVLCLIGFVASIIVLACAYMTLEDNGLFTIDQEFTKATVLMIVGTALFFWSVAGALTAILRKVKGVYYRGLTMFTTRQLSSRMDGACAALTIVCVTLFLGVIVFSTGIGLAKVFVDGAEEGTVFDDTVNLLMDPDSDSAAQKRLFDDPAQVLSQNVPEWSKTVSSAAALHVYNTGMELEQLFRGIDVKSSSGMEPSEMYGASTAIGVTEFNQLRALCGREPISLDADGYQVVNTAANLERPAQELCAPGHELTVAGSSLRAQGDVLEQGLQVSAFSMESCVLVVPDRIAEKLAAKGNLLHVSLNLMFKNPDITAKQAEEFNDKVCKACFAQDASFVSGISAADILNQATSMRFLVTYLALYVGFVLLISAAAILAIQQLSQQSDSVGRYRTLAEIGCSRRAIFGSLKRQTLVYFLAPLGLALCHWACAYDVLQKGLFAEFGLVNTQSIVLAAASILVVYGIYLVLTYLGGRGIVEQSLGKRLLRK